MQVSELAGLNNQILWAAWALSTLFGAIAQRTHFCTMGAVSDVFNMGDGNDWVAHERLRSAIEWREMNLLSTWFNIGTFDLVFVRNVMIYFDVAIKRELFGKLRKVATPDGYLFLGGAESPLNIDSQWVRVPYERGGVYRQLRPGEPPSTNPRSERYPSPQ